MHAFTRLQLYLIGRRRFQPLCTQDHCLHMLQLIQHIHGGIGGNLGRMQHRFTQEQMLRMQADVPVQDHGQGLARLFHKKQGQGIRPNGKQLGRRFQVSADPRFNHSSVHVADAVFLVPVHGIEVNGQLPTLPVVLKQRKPFVSQGHLEDIGQFVGDGHLAGHRFITNGHRQGVFTNFLYGLQDPEKERDGQKDQKQDHFLTESIPEQLGDTATPLIQAILYGRGFWHADLFLFVSRCV